MKIDCPAASAETPPLRNTWICEIWVWVAGVGESMKLRVLIERDGYGLRLGSRMCWGSSELIISRDYTYINMKPLSSSTLPGKKPVLAMPATLLWLLSSTAVSA